MNDRHRHDRLLFYVGVHVPRHFHPIHENAVRGPSKNDNVSQQDRTRQIFRYIQTELNETSHHQKVFQQPRQ